MKFKIKYFNEIHLLICETAFYCAVKRGNIEMVKLLLTCDRIDINTRYVKKKTFIYFI